MTAPDRPAGRKSHRLVAVTLDEASIGRSGPDIEHERAVAIYDLLEENTFVPEGNARGPFKLHLSITGNRLVFDIKRASGVPVMAHLLSLSPLRRIVKDYFMVCDSYYAAIRTATPERIEALDMGRPAAVHAHLRAALEGVRGGRTGAQAAGGAVRLRTKFGALADGGGARAPDVRRYAHGRLGGRAQGRARRVRSRGHERGRGRH